MGRSEAKRAKTRNRRLYFVGLCYRNEHKQNFLANLWYTLTLNTEFTVLVSVNFHLLY